MIKNGREKKDTPPPEFHTSENRRAAKLTAILGTLVFTVFLCLSAGDTTEVQDVGNSFGEGAYQVFAPVGATTETPEDAIAASDGSVWSYLESVIARFIYGER